MGCRCRPVIGDGSGMGPIFTTVALLTASMRMSLRRRRQENEASTID